MKDKHLKAFMQTAKTFAECSTATRAKVGAIIVKDDRIISIGYNGMPTGWDNNCEDIEWCDAGGWLSPQEIEEGWPYIGTYKDADGNEIYGRYRLKTKTEVLHAEANALSKVARSSESSDGAYLFVTHSPCIQCAKMIYQSGIKKVFYREQYRDSAGIDFLNRCNIDVEQLDV